MIDITRTIENVNRGIKAMQFIAGHPQLFADGFDYSVWNATVAVWVYGDYDPETNEEIPDSAKEKLAAAIRTVRRALPGSNTTKSYDDYNFTATITGNDFSISFRTSRKKVCERVVTGTIETEEIDYENAPKRKVEKEVVEWRCDSILESA